MANIWIAPKRGELLNNGQPWKRGDIANITLELSQTGLRSLLLSGGELPPGLYFDVSSRKIRGTVQSIPKGTTSYPVVFRAILHNDKSYDHFLDWKVNPEDEEQHWAIGSGNQFLGTFNRGSGITVNLGIVNLDNDPLVFKAIGHQGPAGSFSGLPNGLEIDSFGRLVGTPTITNNSAGDYWFRVYARDPDDLQRNPRGEGLPRTSSKIYYLTISPNIVLDSRLSDVVKWETPAGSLGSTYETFASHFAVSASPQFEVGGSINEVQKIRYSISPRSRLLPEGIILDPDTGFLIGRCPYVTSTTVYDFTVEARVVFQNKDTGAIRLSTIASERSFSITVLSIFLVDSVTSLQISVPAPARTKIARWIWGSKSNYNLSTSGMNTINNLNTFRNQDSNFGRKREYQILLCSGLDYKSDTEFLDYLKDYHHPTTLRIGNLASARARSPQGVHLYDVLYFQIIDPMEGAAGFDPQNKEQNLNRYLDNQKQTPIPSWNLKANDAHYFPNSIRNLRLDMLNKNNRKDWNEQNQPANVRGLGTVGKEGLPLWMTCEQESGRPDTVLGYQCAIELAYIKAGSGPSIVKTLSLAGINEDIRGTTITVDRYLLLSNGYTSTTFDFDSESGSITSFDGPENISTPTLQQTTLDRLLQSESKYYKFPPGDK